MSTYIYFTCNTRGYAMHLYNVSRLELSKLYVARSSSSFSTVPVSTNSSNFSAVDFPIPATFSLPFLPSARALSTVTANESEATACDEALYAFALRKSPSLRANRENSSSIW
mmetsp:Transcript_20317/g.30548  ORF Transcript_20317/g.30548 Transcript_20317/m.30548 type:complete len:112 (+) Transcript_20317:44-379(+)